jgi:hypothetical protein
VSFVIRCGPAQARDPRRRSATAGAATARAATAGADTAGSDTAGAGARDAMSGRQGRGRAAAHRAAVGVRAHDEQGRGAGRLVAAEQEVCLGRDGALRVRVELPHVHAEAAGNAPQPDTQGAVSDERRTRQRP